MLLCQSGTPACFCQQAGRTGDDTASCCGRQHFACCSCTEQQGDHAGAIASLRPVLSVPITCCCTAVRWLGAAPSSYGWVQHPAATAEAQPQQSTVESTALAVSFNLNTRRLVEQVPTCCDDQPVHVASPTKQAPAGCQGRPPKAHFAEAILDMDGCARWG
jgi:hypothetical protein